jgi:hypothetical protein
MSKISELLGFGEPKYKIDYQPILDLLKDKVVDYKWSGNKFKLKVRQEDAIPTVFYLNNNYKNFLKSKEDSGDYTIFYLN